MEGKTKLKYNKLQQYSLLNLNLEKIAVFWFKYAQDICSVMAWLPFMKWANCVGVDFIGVIFFIWLTSGGLYSIIIWDHYNFMFYVAIPPAPCILMQYNLSYWISNEIVNDINTMLCYTIQLTLTLLVIAS